MNILTIIFFVFAVIGALDYIIDNKFKIGEEFKKGFVLFGSMALSMIGMLVLAPAFGELLRPVLSALKDVLGIDPSIIPAALLANDMGGMSLATELASDPQMGRFNGLIVAAMMGAIISFTVPFALGVVKKEQHDKLLLGLLCGVVAVPFGCFVAGLICGLPFGALLLDLLPLVLLAGALATGLMLCPDVCVKIFRVLGFIVKLVIIVGLMLGAVKSLFADSAAIQRFYSETPFLRSLAPVEDGALLCFRISLTLCGVFPCVYLVSKWLSRPLRALGRKMGINEIAVMGLVANLASNSTVFGTMDKMDDKGVVMNAAFAASAAFVFGSHLAFTQANGPEFLVPMIVAKLVAGVLSLLMAVIVYKKSQQKKEQK